jgi:hypothetical protein
MDVAAWSEPVSETSFAQVNLPIRDLPERRREARASRLFADQWLKDRADWVATLPARTVIVICVATGEYVTASTPVEAMIAFEARFGPNQPGFLHEVGHRVFIGGGIV